MPDTVLYELAERAGRALARRNLMVATAESCTGGWVSEAITMVPGSSEWFERGFVTYTYISKREMLGVNEQTLAQYGAVSEAVVREMAQGALKFSHAQVSLAVSGTAGPNGGTPDKPVGTVCFAWCVKDGEPYSERRYFPGDREEVRRQSVAHALTVLIETVEKNVAASSPQSAPR